MSCLRDEILVAYADDQLSDEKRRAVEHVLAVDEDARMTVAMFKRTTYQVRRAYAGVDFGGVPVWFERLLRNVGARGAGHATSAASACGPRHRRWRLSTFALAACLLLGICIGSLMSADGLVPARSEPLVSIGDVPAASTLAQALDHVSDTGTEWTGPDAWRAAVSATFKDRFGNACREVELFTSVGEEVPAQLVVACRSGAETWTIVGAVTNQVSATSPSGSVIEAYYVPAEDEARSSLDSILSMLGAHQRTPATDRKTTAP